MRYPYRTFRLLVGAIAVATLSVAIASCPLGFDQSAADRLRDVQSPTITILSPGDGGWCGSTAYVTGTAIDTVDGATPGVVSALSYEIANTVLAGDIARQANGEFSFSFPTAGLPSPFYMTCTAVDWNGNSASTTIMVNVGFGLAVQPSSGAVEYTWEPVPGADSYDVYYTSDANPTSGVEWPEGAATGVSSPYTVQGLDNGVLYSHQVCARDAEGEDTWTELVRTIPLSASTLTPNAREGYERVDLDWQSIPGASNFAIERATSPEGPYAELGTVGASTYSDTAVTTGTDYYYRITPTVANCETPTSASTAATPFPFPGETSHLVGYTDTVIDGRAKNVVVHGNYAYVANSDGGFAVISVSDPTNPTDVGRVAMSGYRCEDVDWDGYRCYVAAKRDPGLAGYLMAISVGSPSSPSILDTEDTFIDFPAAVAAYRPDVGHKYAYTIGIQGSWPFNVVWDNINFGVINDPQAMDMGGEEYISAGTLRDISIRKTADTSDARIYVVNDNGLLVYGYKFIGRGSFATPGTAQGVAAAGTYAYVADGTSGLRVINASDPYNPSESSFFTHAGLNATSVAVGGTVAYVTGGTNGLTAVSVGDPETDTPRYLWSHNPPNGALGVDVAGDYAYVAASFNGLYVYYCPTAAAALAVDTLGGFSEAEAVAVAGDYAYVGDSLGESVRVVSIATRHSPVAGTTISSVGYVDRLVIRGRHLFVVSPTGPNNGIHVYDISTPSDPVHLDTYTPPVMSLEDIAVRGDYGYAVHSGGGSNSGLYIFDVSDPANLNVVGEDHVLSETSGVEIVDDIVVISGGENGDVATYEVTDPTTPVYVDRKTLSPSVTLAHDVAVSASGRDVYVSWFDSPDFGIDHYAMDTDGLLTFRERISSASHAYTNMVVRGNYLICGGGSAGVAIFAIETDGSLTELTTVDLGGYGSDVAVTGNYAYATDRTNGVSAVKLWPNW